MKITRIFAHRVELPLREGSYKWAGGESVSVFDSTIVGVRRMGASWGLVRFVRWGRLICRLMRKGVRAGKSLEWDGEKMRASNAPEAERFIRTQQRGKWMV